MAIADNSLPELVKKLESKEIADRIGAADGLRDMAAGGMDIGPALEVLSAAFSDANETVRVRAAWAVAAFRMARSDFAAVSTLLEHKDRGVRFGTIIAISNAAGKGADVSKLIQPVEKCMAAAADSAVKSNCAKLLSDYYIRTGKAEKAAAFLKSPDQFVRTAASSSVLEALVKGTAVDARSAENPLAAMLSDSEESVRRYSAEALTIIYAREKRWKDVDALLANRDGTVRYAAADMLYGFVGSFSIREIPNLLKAVEDSEASTRASRVFEKAALIGEDISFAVPALRSAAAHGEGSMKEYAENALKVIELRKSAIGESGSGKAGVCASCLDCEAGIGPGTEAGSFVEMASIIRGISCCGGDVSHHVFRCSKCGKHYLSTFFDHTDFDRGQFFIYELGKAEAEGVAAELKKCPTPNAKGCDCPVHTAYLKDEKVPVQGKLKYSVESSS